MDLRDFDDDPELGDEDDPEYQLEIFKIFKLKGWKPEDLFDQEYAKKYAEWLKTTAPEPE